MPEKLQGDVSDRHEESETGLESWDLKSRRIWSSVSERTVEMKARRKKKKSRKYIGRCENLSEDDHISVVTG